MQLVDVLAQGERSVEELAAAAHLSVANASRHLQVLRAAGLVGARRDGARMVYRVADWDVVRLWCDVRALAAARLADVERAARAYLGDDVEAISRQDLAERLVRGDVVVIDVRPRTEFAAGHIEGARSIPLDELERHLAELPSDTEVIAYCRGPFCAYAHEAVRRLRRAGRPARRLEDGWPEWRMAALPTAAGQGDRPVRRRGTRRAREAR